MLFLKYISINAKKSMFDFIFLPMYNFVAQVYFLLPRYGCGRTSGDI